MSATSESDVAALSSKVVTTLVFATMALIGLRVKIRMVSHSDKPTVTKSPEFIQFQRNYLLVYLLAMLGDWLQGPYLFALYESYGFSQGDIATLFVTGFAASLCFGTVVGSLSDKMGRRLLVQVFGILYAGCCLMKLVPNYYVLLCGRLLGGTATSLLFSVFEAWMVCEHQKRGFHPDLLTDTFSLATFFNGIVAVLAGFIAHYAVDLLGYSGPFIVAIVPNLAVVFFACCWPENYGSKGGQQSLRTQLSNALNAVQTDSKVASLGAAQAAFEASMYLFVLMWPPAVREGLSIGPDESVPYGLTFAVFMMSMMVGSSLYSYASGTIIPEKMPMSIHSAAFVSLSMAYFCLGSPYLTFLSFMVFECTVGAYFPSYGNLRAKYVREDVRASVMNIFRIPLNILVIFFLQFMDDMTMGMFFACTAALSGISGACYLLFAGYTQAKSSRHTDQSAEDSILQELEDIPDDDEGVADIADDPDLAELAKEVADLAA